MHKAPAVAALTALTALIVAGPAAATPVCTDGHGGGPPRAACGGRVFPEAAGSVAYVQYLPDPVTGFREYQHGVEYLAMLYPRWVSLFTLRDRYGAHAVTAGPDGTRPDDPDDSGDGHDILVIRVTDHEVPDSDKDTLLFSLAVHGNERGGLEGGLRTAEDLAMAAEHGGTIVDGIPNYTSTTGREPTFHEHEVADVLARQVLYLVDFNIDGWAVGDLFAVPPAPYARGNSLGTDINRQMPTIGRINPSRNPLQESEARSGLQLMRDVAAEGRRGLMAHAADIHGELTSNAFIDIMYPAGQFDSIKHRQLMAIAERTKSVVDATLFEGIIDLIEELTGGDAGEGPDPSKMVPTKPAHWATVWDTLGYTDTGFIGDFMATDLAVTGMDHEIFLNHTVPDKVWTVALQENHINGTRAIIKTAMAYALFQAEEFNEDTVVVDPVGVAGYVVNPDRVTDTDANGPGRLPGPDADGIGRDGQPIQQAAYDVSNQQWFIDTNRLMPTPFVPLSSADIAADANSLDAVDTLVLADVALPVDPRARSVDAAAYYAHLRSWVERGGNLVLTDGALHALPDLEVVDPGTVSDIPVYVPYTDFQDLGHHLAEGLRSNARQLVESTILGWGIQGIQGEVTPSMASIDASAWADAGGEIVGTTQDRVTVGELALGEGVIRVIAGALPMPIEDNDHRYGLRDYAMTYTALFLLENALVWDHPDLGVAATDDRSAERPASPLPTTGGGLALVGLASVIALFRWRRA